MATKNYSDLLNKVLAENLDYLRVNEIIPTTNSFKIELRDNPFDKEQDDIYLVDLTTHKAYKLTLRQLASLRIVDSDKLEIKWLHEFKTGANCMNLQTAISQNPGTSIQDMKFVCIADLKLNNAITGTEAKPIPVYKDSCYDGAEDYKKGVHALITGKTREFWKTKEYREGSKALRDALHATKLSKTVTDEDIIKLPVFAIS